MKKLLLLSLGILMGISFAQIDFKLGSAELNTDLNKINADAKLNIGGFKTDIKVGYNISDKTWDGMVKVGMKPAEIYLACEIGKIANKPVDQVVESYKRNKGKGWGVIAKEMGIKPGSPAFHQLKGNCKNKKDKMSKGKGKGNSGKGNAGPARGNAGKGMSKGKK